MGTAFEKAELGAFLSRSLEADTASLISRLLHTGHEQLAAEAARFVLLHAGLIKTAHHLPPPARAA
jgi:hypothetical protein